MKKNIPLSYRTIQKIKAEECERFFSDLPGYYIYMNHLGEIRWMTEEEALKQHEYFLYNESLIRRWQRRMRTRRKINLNKLSPAERELRLRIRAYLEKRYLGKLRPETEQMLPESWHYEISDEEIENIPISLDVGSEELWKKLLWVFGILGAIAIASYIWVSMNARPQTGKLLVRGDVPGARVYLDETDFIGYVNRPIINVPVGLHRISVIKEGYVSIPKYHEIEIVPDSLITLDFKFKVSRAEQEGYLRLITDQPNSKIYIDGNYYGVLEDQPVLVLEEGQHRVSVNKKGYITIPAEKIVNISAGDTSLLIFHQAPAAKQNMAEDNSRRTGIGSIEVNSNVKGARVFLNGKDTEEETDYVFTKLPFGEYNVEVRKEGYSVTPDKVTVKLTPASPTAVANFRLKREFERVRISTNPPKGQIFVDGEFKGEGKFEGVLKIGKHTVTFGDLPGYKTPPKREIEVRSGKPVTLRANYFPVVHIVAEVDKDGNVVTKNCEVHLGYTFRNRAFSTAENAGPEIVFNKKLKEYLWKLGYAFPYRNPKGNDALRVVFQLPRDIDLGFEQPFTVRMWAASSKEGYPLSLTTKVDINVKFNNTILSYRYKPKFLEDIGGLELVEWDVSTALRRGTNIFEVSTTDDNNRYFYIKRIEIFN